MRDMYQKFLVDVVLKQKATQIAFWLIFAFSPWHVKAHYIPNSPDAQRELETAQERAEKMKVLIRTLMELETVYAELHLQLMEAQAFYAETQSQEAEVQLTALLQQYALVSRVLIDAWTDLQWAREDGEKARKSLLESYENSPYRQVQETIDSTVSEKAKSHKDITVRQLKALPKPKRGEKH